MSKTWQYGCLNHGCMFGSPRQGTNSICQCDHPRTPGERVALRKSVMAALTDQEEEIRELCDELENLVLRVEEMDWPEDEIASARAALDRARGDER